MKEDKDVLKLEKSFNLGFVFLILFIFVVIGGFYYCYLNFFNNPEYIIKKSVKNVLANNKVATIDLEKIIRLHGNIDFDFRATNLEEKGLEALNDIDILYNVDADIKNEILNLNLESKYKDNKLIDAKLYNNKNNIYFYLKDVYDKYIKVTKDSVVEDLNNKTNSPDINKKDLEKILNGLLNVLSNTFTEEDFNRETEEISYNDKKRELYKNSIIYNKDNFKRINESFVKNLKEDSELVLNLQKIYGEKELEKYLNNLLTMKDIKNFSCELAIYTEGYSNKFVKLLLKIQDDDDYMIIEVNKENILTLSLMFDKTDLKIDIEKNNENNYIINFNSVLENGLYGNVRINAICENIDSIEKIDDKNIVSLDDLENEELNKIKEKLNENKIINELISDLGVINDD